MVKTEEDLSRRRGAGRAGRLPGADARAVEALDQLGALVGLDAGWTIRSASAGLARLLGRPVESALGLPLRSLLETATADATLGALTEAVQARPGRRIPVPAVLADHRPIVLVPVPARAPSAEILVIASDVLADGGGHPSPGEPAAVFRSRLTEVETQLTEAAILFEVADDLSGSLDPATVARRLVDHAARLCRADVAALERFDPASGQVTLAAVSGHPLAGAGAAARAGDTLAGRALASGVPVEGGRADLDPRYAAALAGGGGSARVLAVPVVTDGQPLGALVVCRSAEAPFTDADVHRARRLARRSALAFRNAATHAELGAELSRARDGEAAVVRREKVAAVARLAAGAAHEINNPLAAVVGNAELLLRRDELVPAGRERAERIVSAAYRVSRIVEALLAYARADAIAPEPIDVGRLLRDTVAGRREALEAAGVRVADELTALPPVAADARQLAKVFASVVQNGLDALRERSPGERTLRLAGRPVDGGVELAIENSGPPIPPAVLPRIFDPFFTTREVGQGLGLGLAVADGIVAAHGGEIRAENLPDAAGVAIRIRLPLARA
jgi:signal transduction histidine kinase